MRDEPNAAVAQGADQASDEGLMARYAAGDAAAFPPLYARYRGPVYRYLLRQLRGDAETAHDLFQDVWQRLVDSRRRFDPDSAPHGGFRSYLFALAHNRLVDHIRREARTSRRFQAGGLWVPEARAPRSDEPPVRVQAEEKDRRLEAALRTLPAEQREAFLLRLEGGLEVAEIARLTGVGPEAAKSRLRYARERLTALLGEEGEA